MDQHPHLFVQAPVRPLDEDAVTAMTVGTICFAVMTVVMGLRLDELRTHDSAWWFWTAVAGTVIGALGLVYCLRRRNSRRSAGQP